MLDLIQVRKELHKIPELAFEEFQTTEYIKKVLEKFDNLKLHFPDCTGLVAEYTNGAGDYTLFRADIDALPLTEETGCDFASENKGKMHACGHEVHITVLIGLIEKICERKIEGNFLFVFQPAEEGKGGALKILESGILDNFKIRKAFALHVKGDIHVGTVSSKSGIFFANTTELDVIFRGVSAHVAFAEKGRDALKAGLEFYNELEKALQTEFANPSQILCKFGKMFAGNVRNAVPDKCILEGTSRAISNMDFEKLNKLIKTTADKVAKQHSVRAEVVFTNFYKAVDNEEETYNKFKKMISESEYKFLEYNTVMGGEDFGFMIEKYGGLLFLLGADNGQKQDLHSTKFLADERCIDVGVDVFWKIIENGI